MSIIQDALKKSTKRIRGAGPAAVDMILNTDIGQAVRPPNNYYDLRKKERVRSVSIEIPHVKFKPAHLKYMIFAVLLLATFVWALVNARGAYELNGIMYIAGSSQAIVNNMIVSEGDRVGDATVVKISQDSVQLKDGNRVVTLKGIY